MHEGGGSLAGLCVCACVYLTLARVCMSACAYVRERVIILCTCVCKCKGVCIPSQGTYQTHANARMWFAVRQIGGNVAKVSKPPPPQEFLQLGAMRRAKQQWAAENQKSRIRDDCVQVTEKWTRQHHDVPARTVAIAMTRGTGRVGEWGTVLFTGNQEQRETSPHEEKKTPRSGHDEVPAGVCPLQCTLGPRQSATLCAHSPQRGHQDALQRKAVVDVDCQVKAQRKCPRRLPSPFDGATESGDLQAPSGGRKSS